MSKTAETLTCLILIFLFSDMPLFAGQMRTYVGPNDTVEEVSRIRPAGSAMNKEGQNTAVKENQGDKTRYVYPVPPESAVLPKPFSDVPIKRNEESINESQDVTETNSKDTGKIPEKIPEDQVKVISHDHIKLGGGYEMKGEPDKK